jgi:hypothetical protein
MLNGGFWQPSRSDVRERLGLYFGFLWWPQLVHVAHGTAVILEPVSMITWCIVPGDPMQMFAA